MEVVDSAWKGRCPRVLQEAQSHGSVSGAGLDSPKTWLTSTVGPEEVTTSVRRSDSPPPLECGQHALCTTPQGRPELWTSSTHRERWRGAATLLKSRQTRPSDSTCIGGFNSVTMNLSLENLAFPTHLYSPIMVQGQGNEWAG